MRHTTLSMLRFRLWMERYQISMDGTLQACGHGTLGGVHLAKAIAGQWQSINTQQKGKQMQKKVQKFIVRCHLAGVFYGEIKSRSDHEVVMTNVRKVWYWDGACAVEELATHGTTCPENCKFTVKIDEMTILNPIQIIPCTEKAVASLEKAHEWSRA